mmetsp:Transcript_619/g.1947  ORF Transcript_619/g.1947 Transcript_619/m.1947 type:complete len:204 (-) Transcript_619:890-1501(-)
MQWVPCEVEPAVGRYLYGHPKYDPHGAPQRDDGRGIERGVVEDREDRGRDEANEALAAAPRQLPAQEPGGHDRLAARREPPQHEEHDRYEQRVPEERRVNRKEHLHPPRPVVAVCHDVHCGKALVQASRDSIPVGDLGPAAQGPLDKMLEIAPDEVVEGVKAHPVVHRGIHHLAVAGQLRAGLRVPVPRVTAEALRVQDGEVS